MKALITAAGMGTRLGYLTKETNKCLLPIGGKPLLIHAIEMLKKSGISEIYIVIGYHGNQVKKKLGNDINYIYNPNYATTSILGSIILAKDHLVNSSFVFMTGDSLIHPTLLNSFLAEKGEILASIEEKKCDEEDYKVILAGDTIQAMGKNILIDKAHAEFTGMVKFSAAAGNAFFIHTYNHLMNNTGKKYLGEMIMDLQNNGFKIRPIFTGKYPRIEIDFPKDLEMAQELYDKFF